MDASFKTYPGHTTCTLYLVPLPGATGVPAPGGYAAAESAGGLYTTGAIAEPLVGEFEAYALNGAGSLVFSGYWHSSGTRCYDYTRAPDAAGSGPYLLTVTVETGAAAPIPGAVVTAFAGGLASGTATTGAPGTAVLGLAAGSYTLVCIAPGYVSQAVGHVVVAAGGVTITLVAVSAPPATPAGTVVGYWVAYDENGAPEPGAEVTVELTDTAGTTGHAVDSQPRTITSAGDGLVYVPGMHPGCTYRFTRGGGPGFSFTVPADAVGNVALSDIHGCEEV